jgi:hypothetical protein
MELSGREGIRSESKRVLVDLGLELIDSLSCLICELKIEIDGVILI